MPRGGKRVGAGRKPGSKNKLTPEAKALARATVEQDMAKLYELAHTAESENVQLGSLKERLNRGFGRPAVAAPEPAPVVKVVRTYRWARTPEEAIYDPAWGNIQRKARVSRKVPSKA